MKINKWKYALYHDERKCKNLNNTLNTNIDNIINIDTKINQSKGALYQDERKCNPW